MPNRWQKGQSGNPRGRPPRKLSTMLATVGEQPDYAENVANALWQFATTGKVTLGDHTLRAETVTEWFHAVKWIYEHIDGKQPQHIESEITIIVEYETDADQNPIAEALPATTIDSRS